MQDRISGFFSKQSTKLTSITISFKHALSGEICVTENTGSLIDNARDVCREEDGVKK